MYKVFLVEDEIVLREGIKNNIQWESEGCTIVGDESDGELAYPMILREQPDILITDIKMPFMDGLELSKLIKKELPQIKIIIISGYSDFSFAQQAIDIGVTEYLLKPVTPDKLTTSVKNATRVIEKERKGKQILDQYQLLVYQKQGEKRKDFFNALVSKKMTLSQIVEQEEELGINMVASVFCVILFQFKAQEDMYKYSDEIVQCESRMQEALRNFSGVRVFERGMDGWAFILLGENEEKIEELIQELCNILMQISNVGVNYFGGIGRSVCRIRDLQQSFADANKAFSLRYFEHWNQFKSYDDTCNIKDQTEKWTNIRELNLEKLDRTLLEEFLKRGTIQDVNEFVNRYFEGLDSNTEGSDLLCQYIMMDGYSAMVKFLKNLKYSKETIDNSLKDMMNFNEQPAGLTDCRKFYKSILKEAIELRNMNSQKKYSALIEKAKDYIYLNYSMSELTLDKVASKVNISPNYFSTMFNQEMGMTFIEYLTDIRMDKAKEYLRCSSKRITEIGYMVGYLDSHYFSYIFKKTQNCTPSEYRTQGIGGE